MQRYERPDPALGLVRRGWLPLAMALFGALVVLLVVGGVAQQLASEKTAILEEARKHTSNLARAFEEHIRRTVKEVDQALLVLKRGEENDPQNFKLWEWPGKELLLQDLSVQIAMADKDGILVGTTEGPAPVTASVKNEDYFLYHVNHPDNALFFGKPVRGGGAEIDGFVEPRQIVRVERDDQHPGKAAVGRVQPARQRDRPVPGAAAPDRLAEEQRVVGVIDVIEEIILVLD